MPVKQSLQILLLVCMASASASACADREKFSLERFDVDKLEIWNTAKNNQGGVFFAYVRDPDGFIHHVEIGEYIGNRNGKVVLIEKCQLTVSELFFDSNGGWIERERLLKSADGSCAERVE